MANNAFRISFILCCNLRKLILFIIYITIDITLQKTLKTDCCVMSP